MLPRLCGQGRPPGGGGNVYVNCNLSCSSHDKPRKVFQAEGHQVWEGSKGAKTWVPVCWRH